MNQGQKQTLGYKHSPVHLRFVVYFSALELTAETPSLAFYAQQMWFVMYLLTWKPEKIPPPLGVQVSSQDRHLTIVNSRYAHCCLYSSLSFFLFFLGGWFLDSCPKITGRQRTTDNGEFRVHSETTAGNWSFIFLCGRMFIMMIQKFLCLPSSSPKWQSIVRSAGFYINGAELRGEKLVAENFIHINANSINMGSLLLWYDCIMLQMLMGNLYNYLHEC